jgi:hypothetical protein
MHVERKRWSFEHDDIAAMKDGDFTFSAQSSTPKCSPSELRQWGIGGVHAAARGALQVLNLLVGRLGGTIVP